MPAFCFIQAKKMNINTKKSIRVALLAVFIGVFAFSALGYAIASSITADNIIKLVNDARTGEGLKALQENSKLSKAAEEKAQDMIKDDYFAHNSPDNKTPWYWIEKSNYDYKYAGENLAMNFSSAEDEQKAWMKSESHRKNILNSNYQEIGVAVEEGKIDGQSTTVVVQMFGSRPDFIPAGKPVAEKTLPENKAAVLGEENNLVRDDILSIPAVVPKNGNGMGWKSAGSQVVYLWQSLKNILGQEQMATLALIVLWIILVGNIFFLAYAISQKAKVFLKEKESSEKEQKIPVRNLDVAEKEAPVAIKIHILRTAR